MTHVMNATNVASRGLYRIFLELDLNIKNIHSFNLSQLVPTTWFRKSIFAVAISRGSD
jgi:hypothetical protein